MRMASHRSDSRVNRQGRAGRQSLKSGRPTADPDRDCLPMQAQQGPRMEPLPAPEPFPSKARRILVAAAVIQVALFVYHARGSFRDLFDPLPETPADRTGPFSKGSDCIGYYAWLRSPLIDGDFQFD